MNLINVTDCGFVDLDCLTLNEEGTKYVEKKLKNLFTSNPPQERIRLQRHYEQDKDRKRMFEMELY